VTWVDDRAAERVERSATALADVARYLEGI
jgi:hypothetical protein